MEITNLSAKTYPTLDSTKLVIFNIVVFLHFCSKLEVILSWALIVSKFEAKTYFSKSLAFKVHPLKCNHLSHQSLYRHFTLIILPKSLNMYISFYLFAQKKYRETLNVFLMSVYIHILLFNTIAAFKILHKTFQIQTWKIHHIDSRWYYIK